MNAMKFEQNKPCFNIFKHLELIIATKLSHKFQLLVGISSYPTYSSIYSQSLVSFFVIHYKGSNIDKIIYFIAL